MAVVKEKTPLIIVYMQMSIKTLGKEKAATCRMLSSNGNLAFASFYLFLLSWAKR